jgi:hypothetical protein
VSPADEPPRHAARLRDRSRGDLQADTLFRELATVGVDRRRIRDLLRRWDPEDTLLRAVLKRAVPVALLEELGTTPPWSDRPRVLGGVACNPRTPRSLTLRVLPALYWPDLAEVAAHPYLSGGVRARAEGLLTDLLRDLRLGERISLARQATPAVLKALLSDAEARVVRAALQNPRLREGDVVEALRGSHLAPPLPRELSVSARWSACYAVRLALVLQPRTPLGIVLAQLTSLTPADLRRVAETDGLLPLVQASAARASRGSDKTHMRQGFR